MLSKKVLGNYCERVSFLFCLDRFLFLSQFYTSDFLSFVGSDLFTFSRL